MGLVSFDFALRPKIISFLLALIKMVLILWKVTSILGIFSWQIYAMLIITKYFKSFILSKNKNKNSFD